MCIIGLIKMSDMPIHKCHIARGDVPHMDLSRVSSDIEIFICVIYIQFKCVAHNVAHKTHVDALYDVLDRFYDVESIKGPLCARAIMPPVMSYCAR